MKRLLQLSLAIAILLNPCAASAQYASSARTAFRLPTQAVHGQLLLRMIPSAREQCRVSTLTAYDMRGFWFPATVRVCSNSIEDISTGSLAPPPGTRLFFNNGRAKRGSLYSLTRARPNTAYEFVRNDNDENGYMTYAAARQTRWANVVSSLPFVPFSLATYQQNGYTRYAYHGLRIPRGMERFAYPLTADSAVLSVDGFIFSTPDALPAMLGYHNSDTPYVEVFYMQLSERPQRMRRAFIPRLKLNSAGADWQRLAQSTTVGERNRSGNLIGTVAAIAALALIWRVIDSPEFFVESKRQYRACIARNEPLIIC